MKGERSKKLPAVRGLLTNCIVVETVKVPTDRP